MFLYPVRARDLKFRECKFHPFFFVSLSFIPCRYGSWLFLYKGDLAEAFTSSVSICIYPRRDFTRKVLYAIQLIRNLRISPLLVYPGRVPRLIVAFGCWADDTCCSGCWKRSSKVDPIFVTKRQVLQIPFQSPKSDVFNGCCPLSNASHRVRISNSSSLNAFKIECGISKPNESQQPITTYRNHEEPMRTQKQNEWSAEKR